MKSYIPKSANLTLTWSRRRLDLAYMNGSIPFNQWFSAAGRESDYQRVRTKVAFLTFYSLSELSKPFIRSFMNKYNGSAFPSKNFLPVIILSYKVWHFRVLLSFLVVSALVNSYDPQNWQYLQCKEVLKPFLSNVFAELCFVCAGCVMCREFVCKLTKLWQIWMTRSRDLCWMRAPKYIVSLPY